LAKWPSDAEPSIGTGLPSGRSINLFFYDGPISRAIAGK
jgi:beta-lactam-binding protein with PASTA domain